MLNGRPREGTGLNSRSVCVFTLAPERMPTYLAGLGVESWEEVGVGRGGGRGGGKDPGIFGLLVTIKFWDPIGPTGTTNTLDTIL